MLDIQLEQKLNNEIKRCKTLGDKIKIAQKYNISLSEIDFRYYMLKHSKRKG